MVKVSRQSFRSMVITNIRLGSGITKKLLDELVREIVQNDIAELFLKERTVLGALKPPRNAAYKARKAKANLPFGNKKGHFSGKLQRALDRNKLWTINSRRPTKGKPGRAVVILDNKKLQRLVKYAAFYAKGYTQQGAGMLIVSKKHVNEMQTTLRKQDSGTVKKGSINKAFSRVAKKANDKTRRRRRA